MLSLLCFQRELKEKQIDVLKTITAADNAINKLQLNTVTIEVKQLLSGLKGTVHHK